MSFATKKLNNEVVKEVPTLTEKDRRKIKGAALFPEIYCNVFLCARKKSGKTSVIYKILKRCCGRNTRIVAFCSTLNKDASWETIQAWAQHKNIPFVGHTGIKEGKKDLLAELIASLEQKEEIEEKVKGLLDSDSDEEEEERPPKYRAPDYIFILDDLSHELRYPSLTALLKKNRHFKAKVLLSSQWLNDLKPEARRQIDYFILFKGQSENKLPDIYRDADLPITPEQFQEVYDYATEEPYSFLYIDQGDKTFRRNFNTLIEM